MTRPLTLQKFDLEWTIAVVEGELDRARARCERMACELAHLLDRREQIQAQLDARRLAGLGGNS